MRINNDMLNPGSFRQVSVVEYVARNPDQLALALKLSRRQQRLTQADLGSLVGVGQSHLSVIEGHGARATVETLYKLLAALHLELVLRDAEALPAET